jgi:hypothetical protein
MLSDANVPPPEPLPFSPLLTQSGRGELRQWKSALCHKRTSFDDDSTQRDQETCGVRGGLFGLFLKTAVALRQQMTPSSVSKNTSAENANSPHRVTNGIRKAIDEWGTGTARTPLHRTLTLALNPVFFRALPASHR